MKKLISLALTLAILASLAISVSAAYPDGYPNVVGTHGKNASNANSVNDGVASFPDTDPAVKGTTVTVNATVGEIQSRYAVDIDYVDLQVSVSGSDLVWDVNKLEYVASGDPSVPANTTTDVKFTNYSDKSVYVSYDETDADAADHLTVGVTVTEGAAVEGTKYEITRAQAKVGSTPGKATDRIFTLTVAADDSNWNQVAEYYAAWFSAHPGESSTQISSITFVVSMNPNP